MSELTLGRRLQCYIQVFSKRDDIEVVSCDFGSALDVSGLWEHLPEAVLEIAREANGLHFEWRANPAVLDDPSLGGCISLAPLTPEPPEFGAPLDWQPEGHAGQRVWDEAGEAGTTYLVHDERRASNTASPIYYDGEDGAYYDYANAAYYLRSGASRAFAWRWQNDAVSAQHIWRWLSVRSIGREVGHLKRVSRLRSAGLNTTEARDLADWLADDLCVLLTR